MENEGTSQLTAEDVIGRRVLILGEVRSGKTALLARLLKELTEVADAKEITVIDLAPQRIGEIGGKISDYLDSVEEIRYLSPKRVYTPRVTGSSREEVLAYAELNRSLMEPLFAEFVQRATKVLVLNDVTLYLHAGELGRILNCVKLAETFVATAYYGSRLAQDRGAGISIREKKLIRKLASYVDQIVKM